MTNTEIPAITEAEWEQLADAWPPVVEREDGSLLVIAGIWSNGHRSYAYASAEIAQKWPEEAAGMGLVKIIDRARGKDVEDYRRDADTDFDGNGYHLSGKTSRISVLWIPSSVPIRVKIGSTYHSSQGTPRGQSTVHFYGGARTAAAYRTKSQTFQRDHEDEYEPGE